MSVPTKPYPLGTDSGAGRPPLVRRYLRLAFATALLPLSLACGSETADSPGGDAADQQEYQGLSREEIELQAEPMSLEQAESLGIVDTTIRMQPPMNPDSVQPVDTAVVP